jgi:hypothetical protein
MHASSSSFTTATTTTAKPEGEISSNPVSHAKRRMDAMATNIDHKLAAAFIAILILYIFLTLGTWQSLEEVHRHEGIEQTLFNVLLNNEMKTDEGNSYKLIENIDALAKAEDFTDTKKLQRTFPIHASKNHDFEVIDHPGIFLAKPNEMKKILKEHAGQLPADGKMTVPKFWRPKSYEGGVREFLGSYGERLITPEEANQIGSVTPEEGLKTIYISVASYRDPECQPTVEDIFLRAEHPERLRVAIVEQRVKGEDDATVPNCDQPTRNCTDDPNQALCLYGHLVDIFVVPAILSVGPVFARHLATRMYRGEYFAMQVDSHVRFIEHWDTNLISQWESANNEMAVITTYLSDIINSITPDTHENNHPNRPIMW